jgi:hypothetical protein
MRDEEMPKGSYEPGSADAKRLLGLALSSEPAHDLERDGGLLDAALPATLGPSRLGERIGSDASDLEDLAQAERRRSGSRGRAFGGAVDGMAVSPLTPAQAMVPPGSVLQVILSSPLGTTSITPSPVVLAAQVVTSPPLGSVYQVAGLWLDVGASFFVVGPSAIGLVPVLGAQPLVRSFQIPPGLGGITMVLQGGAVGSAFAGGYALSDAYLLSF